MQKILIITNGYFGDIAFASSLAKKLYIDESTTIDYLIGFPQMKSILSNNPYITNVFVSDIPNPNPISSTLKFSDYDRIIKLPTLSFEIPPVLEYQLFAGVTNPDSEFYLYTSPEYDIIAKKIIEDLKTDHHKPVVCILSNWEERTFSFTKQQYNEGKDKRNNFGYGNKRRNIKSIISKLEKYIYPIEVGFSANTSQKITCGIKDNDQKSILFECSLMKYCDAFIGTEGGLCNLAAGVGTKTIITGDFVLQVYGYNGSVKQIKLPKLGPIHYFNNNLHIELDPFLTDDEVATEILKNI